MMDDGSRDITSQSYFLHMFVTQALLSKNWTLIVHVVYISTAEVHEP